MIAKEQLKELVGKAWEAYVLLDDKEEPEKTLRNALISMSTIGQISLSMMDEIARKEIDLINLKKDRDGYIESIEKGLFPVGYEVFMETLDKIIDNKSGPST